MVVRGGITRQTRIVLLWLTGKKNTNKREHERDEGNNSIIILSLITER